MASCPEPEAAEAYIRAAVGGNGAGGYTLGVDIGSVALSYVLIDPAVRIAASGYCFHQGDITRLLRETLAALDLSRVRQVAYTHRSADFFAAGLDVNEQVALIEGARWQQPDIGSLFSIGGETFGLILFDQQGRYRKYLANSSCAAGTGAFLDQQAERLGLAGSAELSRLAEAYSGEPPKIATRCAVFAKTDLIHCQQQGYSLEAICAGLCQGLAHNIADTLIKGVRLRGPVVAVGGVSRNVKVMHYLAELIGHPITIPPQAELTGAIGCALIAQRHDGELPRAAPYTVETLLRKREVERRCFFPPLTRPAAGYPDFADHPHYTAHDVEVDLYGLGEAQTFEVAENLEGQSVRAWLGIDVGSTSTKAVVMADDADGTILLGLYTRTMGQPIRATQSLLRVLDEIQRQRGICFDLCGVGTTGSGRAFIQKALNADLAVDEISAHARAAYALHPAVDTIIEIGGQDSKFTVMKDGQVTFSVMNYVCAAGTGSFIEEQAKRLDVPLDAFAERALGAPSPLTSDRCTVFMERDLNHYLCQGYGKEELLAAALHSIRDNYLSKVAHLNKIGQVICFQGATAKNAALVAAFEQKLQRPIFVSRYCHLTGALGVCLLLRERGVTQSLFRGIEFHRESPIVEEEVCDLCTNHCKLKRMILGDESVTWGFLCGRDESGPRRQVANPAGFDLLSNRRRVFDRSAMQRGAASADASVAAPHAGGESLDLSVERLRENLGVKWLDLRHRLFAIRREALQGASASQQLSIGLPNALYMLEYLPFWRLFFRRLGYAVHVSTAKAGHLEAGREITGGGFCAPISAWHGHVQEVARRSDYVWTPHMLEGGEAGDPKFYCYYSNYAVALQQANLPADLAGKTIEPLVDFSRPALQNVQAIYESLPPALQLRHTPGEIWDAYVQAWRWFKARQQQLVEVFQEEWRQARDVSVVLLGRPYLAMDPTMNKRIPETFNQFGVKTFFQDMLPVEAVERGQPSEEFVDWNQWRYGDAILHAAAYIGPNRGLYPVYLSAFKCSPDSFVLAYFREIMDAYQKPYLVLQIDEHGSDVGYSTRIEAAIETFRNHYRRSAPVAPAPIAHLVTRTPPKQQTMLVPNYDSLACSLMCAAFEHAGYHARLIEESPTTVTSSLRLNDGQCLPVSAIVQGAVETIRRYQLDPANTTIFLNAVVRTACNFPQYPLMAARLLQQQGDGFEAVQVFATPFTLLGLPLELIYDVYCGYLLGGLIRRIGCRLRPYELVPGQINRLIEDARERLYRCIAAGGSKEDAFQAIVADFRRIAVRADHRRPKVAIIGDLYVRDNDVFNQGLIADLEAYGAEVVTTPVNFLLRLTLGKESRQMQEDGRYHLVLRDRLAQELLELIERRFYAIAGEILEEGYPEVNGTVLDCMPRYHLTSRHLGETAQNVLKVFSLLQHFPDLALIVHANPIFCCPGLVSEAIFKAVEADIGIPIVSLVYDGAAASKNEALAPYLHYILQA